MLVNSPFCTDAGMAAPGSFSSPKRLSQEKWHAPVVNSECTLHQLAPYIGKLKSSIAADIVEAFSRPGEIVADPFCGAGTIAFEARLAGRKVFASDISPYAFTLTHAKLRAPDTLADALDQMEDLLRESEESASPDLPSVPAWVRSYFHPRTLREAVSFSRVCHKHENTLGMSCLLGILHHQRPGFLSFPSSHLVPYLRANKFPIATFPSMYEYRSLRPRLLSKVTRAYKRVEVISHPESQIVQSSIDDVELPPVVDAVITSPPYMNALDYGRDNRLRLWFVDPTAADAIDSNTPSTMEEFTRLMTVLANKVDLHLRCGGYCVLVVGDKLTRRKSGHTADAAIEVFLRRKTSFELVTTYADQIPDVRRSRPDCRGVKGESIIILRKIGQCS